MHICEWRGAQKVKTKLNKKKSKNIHFNFEFACGRSFALIEANLLIILVWRLPFVNLNFDYAFLNLLSA